MTTFLYFAFSGFVVFLMFDGGGAIADTIRRYFKHRERMIELKTELKAKELEAAQAQIDAANKLIESENVRLQRQIEQLENDRFGV